MLLSLFITLTEKFKKVINGLPECNGCVPIAGIRQLLAKNIALGYSIYMAVLKRKPSLSKYLFWDIDMHKLDYENRASFILERVFTMGMQEDEWKVNKYYGKERIKKEVIKCKALDKKTLNYLSVFYEIPKKDFICYTKDVFQKGF